MWENITSTTKGDATWEIIIMLLVAFILGYLLRYFLGDKKTDDTDYKAELERLRNENTDLIKANARLKSDLEECMKQSVVTPVAAVAAAAVAMPAKPANPDDLKKVEGIGPKLEEILNNGGIWTWAQLADSKVERLKELIIAEWPNNKVHDPGTWPKQAEMARDGKWDELKVWQDELDGGK